MPLVWDPSHDHRRLFRQYWDAMELILFSIQIATAWKFSQAPLCISYFPLPSVSAIGMPRCIPASFMWHMSLWSGIQFVNISHHRPISSTIFHQNSNSVELSFNSNPNGPIATIWQQQWMELQWNKISIKSKIVMEKSLIKQNQIWLGFTILKTTLLQF